MPPEPVKTQHYYYFPKVKAFLDEGGIELKFHLIGNPKSSYLKNGLFLLVYCLPFFLPCFPNEVVGKGKERLYSFYYFLCLTADYVKNHFLSILNQQK